MTRSCAISAWFGHQRPMFCFSNVFDVSKNKGSFFLVSKCDFWPTLVSIAPEVATRERYVWEGRWMTRFCAISAWFGHQRPLFCFSNACNVSIYKGSDFTVSICDFWSTLVSIALEVASRER